MSAIENKPKEVPDMVTIAVDSLGEVQNPTTAFSVTAVPGIVPDAFEDAKAYALQSGLTVYQADLKGFRKKEDGLTFDLGA